MTDKKLTLLALKNRYNTILTRGKSGDGTTGVLTKIMRKIRKLEKEISD